MKSIVVAALMLMLSAPALAASGLPSTPGAAADPRSSAAHRLDINRATAAELVGVPGLGDRLAQAIIELREKKGRFATLDELLEVRGIGEKNLALLAEHLTVAQQTPVPAGGVASQVK